MQAPNQPRRTAFQAFRALDALERAHQPRAGSGSLHRLGALRRLNEMLGPPLL